MWNFTDKLKFKETPMGCSFREMSNLYKYEQVYEKGYGWASKKVHKTPQEIVQDVVKDVDYNGTHTIAFTDVGRNPLPAFIKKYGLGTITKTKVPGGRTYFYMWRVCTFFAHAVKQALAKDNNKNVNKTSKRNRK